MEPKFLFPIDFIHECFKMSYYNFEGVSYNSQGFRKLYIEGGEGTSMPLYFAASRDPNAAQRSSSKTTKRQSNSAPNAPEDLFIFVRGTTTIDDILRDLDFQTIEMFDGKIHEGAFNAAFNIINALYDNYIKECKGNVFVVGHSLGGAVAAVITAILRLGRNMKNVYGILAAPFPPFTKNIRDATKDFIISFIHANDIVPRVNMFNITKFQFDQYDKPLSVEKVVSKFTMFLENIFIGKKEIDVTRLYLPGEIYNLKPTLYNDEERYICVPYEETMEIKADISTLKKEITEHFLMNYCNALANYIKFNPKVT